MTPAARYAAAIDVLDQILDGQPAEAALLKWARGNRYAGSKDRAAVRDHVFDCLRSKASFAAKGGDQTGRAIVAGCLLAQNTDLDEVFSGQGYAAAPLDDAELERLAPDADAVDLPEWLLPKLRDVAGPDFQKLTEQFRQRADVFLRVNTQKIDIKSAEQSLDKEGISTSNLAGATTALRVTSGARQVARSAPFLSGEVELQDASSQKACLMLGAADGETLLDYCAGGGGKSLALAAMGYTVTAHDADPKRMKDIGPRAERAGVTIPQVTEITQQFDTVVIDAPCSGSGTWRRTPDAKWRFTEQDLADLVELQRDIIGQAQGYALKRFVYMTCSLLRDENEDQVAFVEASLPKWTCVRQERFAMDQDGDGFFCAIFEQA
ncbi:RsmB/NOP family class I SAM-dependent RNA methyltransferase [Nereida ignava]|uniref:RsmB/NOP family class I SAM-dependent RNA methyltransferase n=1 Tax=Nereida ignava TaxID=282199 RepID=UPI0030F91AD4